MRQEAVSVLHPLGYSPPPALVELPGEVARRSMQTLMPIISAFMKCFCKMISGLYPVQVALLCIFINFLISLFDTFLLGCPLMLVKERPAM